MADDGGRGPRIALAGIILESNSFAPVSTEADFKDALYIEGDEMVARARQPVSSLPREFSAFVQSMDATGPWQPAPLLLTGNPPWGPVEQDFFDACLQRIEAMIDEAGPLDGIYICNHGAMTATGDYDPDGTMLRRLRQCLGGDGAIIVTLDLHANISDAMVEAADVIVGYRTNPHVDQLPRGEEAAVIMRQMMAGLKPQGVVLRLPLTPPSVTLLTAAGPYGELIQYGERRKLELSNEILNVSIFGGFTFADTPVNGLATVVTARRDVSAAHELAVEIATRAWDQRRRFKRDLMAIDDAVALAQATAADTALAANIFSDVGDNPGGGGEGRTMWLLQALVAAQAKGVLYGSFFDPALAAEAHEQGEGANFQARFNRDFDSPYSKPYAVEADVLALHDGDFVGRLGIYQGRRLRLGPCAALQIGGRGGIVAIVISARHQTADPVFFEMFDLDIAAARTVCVKSRGHFRAGFSPWFAPEQVHEVDTAGLTSPVLTRFEWKGLPRPSYPLDEDAEWAPPAG